MQEGNALQVEWRFKLKNAQVLSIQSSVAAINAAVTAVQNAFNAFVTWAIDLMVDVVNLAFTVGSMRFGMPFWIILEDC